MADDIRYHFCVMETNESRMDEFFARCTDDRRNFQLLSGHLRGVARRCVEFASGALRGDARFAEIAEMTGLLHDLGKYRDEFRRYLRAGTAQRSAETAHAMYGAAAACFEFNLQLAAFVIAGHHAGLHDASDLQQLLEGKKFQADRRYPELLRRAQQADELESLPAVDPIPFDESDDADKRRYEFFTRMLFSMLVDADRLDSEQWEQKQRLNRPWNGPSRPLVAGRLLELLDAERRRRAESAPADDLLRLRNEVFEACMAKGRDFPPGFFTLTVPTGGAKTLSSMAFSLAHAERHELRRVIVVIPYLSIIEQNARDYRKILGTAQVLEHHSAVDLVEKQRKENLATGDEPAGASDAEQGMENWDAPIIVTTSVQFIETLFAASPSRARNPNGDPDAGNLPRIDPTTNKGLVSDVCLKRKVCNFIAQFPPTRKADNANGFAILVQQGNVLNNELDRGIQEGIKPLVATELQKLVAEFVEKKGSQPSEKELEKLAKQAKDNLAKKEQAEAAMKWLCREFFDVRTFGGVLSTGDDVLKGSAYGQVRGPVQFTFGRSVDPITPLEISITRCAVTKPEDEKKERTMGNKHIVPYALYVAKAYISPVFAERTGFDEEDMRLFFEALEHMFTHDQSAARAEMNVRAIYDFEHVGTQGAENASQNVREAKLGCAHAHQLFNGVLQHLKLADGKEFPERFEDYGSIKDDWSDKESGEIVVPGVRLHRRVAPE